MGHLPNASCHRRADYPGRCPVGVDRRLVSARDTRDYRRTDWQSPGSCRFAWNAVAVWEEQPVNPGPGFIQASFRSAGGMWSTPVDISSGNVASRPQIVMDPEGNAIVMWLGFDSVQSAVRLASNGMWQQSVEVSAIDLAAGGSPGAPALAVDGLGDVVTAWSSTIGSGSNHVVQAATLPAGGTWQTPVDLSEAGLDAGSPDVALNPAGDAVVTWSAAASAIVGSKSAVIQATVRPTGGTWQAPVDISEPGQVVDEPPFEPKAVVDPRATRSRCGRSWTAKIG